MHQDTPFQKRNVKNFLGRCTAPPQTLPQYTWQSAHNSYSGLNESPAWFLRVGAPVFCRRIAVLFNLSHVTSSIPQQRIQATRYALDYANLTYATPALFSPKNLTLEPNMTLIGWPIAEIWPTEIFKMVAGRHLGFALSGSSAVRSGVTLCKQSLTNMLITAYPQKATECMYLGYTSYISWVMANFILKFAHFCYDSNRSLSEQSLTDNVKFADT